MSKSATAGIPMLAVLLTANADPSARPCAPERAPASCAALAASAWAHEILEQEQAVQEACRSAETATSEEDRRFYEAQCRAATERFAPDHACAEVLLKVLRDCNAL